jgi:short-subunit dehydrogenase involved in D-alanine esterification of teichoic acids
MSETKSAKAAKMSKFQEILTSSGQEVLDKRSTIVLSRTKAAMTDKLTALKRQRESLELDELNLVDVSVETRDSLRPTSKNFNPVIWTEQLLEINMALKDINDEIEVAEALYSEYFG